MMKNIIQNIKVNLMWTMFFIVAGTWVVWQWIKAYWDDAIQLDFDDKPRPAPGPKYKKLDPDKYSTDYFQRLNEVKEAKKLKEKQMKEQECWELFLENRNHYTQAAHLILRTSSFELASYIMNNLVEAYKDYGYSTFTLYIKSGKGGIIVKGGTHAS
jgi:hypothetical protein